MGLGGDVAGHALLPFCGELTVRFKESGQASAKSVDP